ncbi:hypothetical protein NW762_010864 [Fusarium torreyae]|uniref:Uncharacterized protein n=1 Tax=Fusarium torreyae TaxID=1237075 RepID=A0A9W8RTD4_9HYPO|nr:hypothetical protein NW762_010864 [Fusarium torreyae]
MSERRLRGHSVPGTSTPSYKTKLKLTNEKKGQPDKTWRLWGDDHFQILLAHVEWCVINKKNLYQDAAPLFRKAVGRDYTDSAIRHKLRAECSSYLDDKFSLHTLFNGGISYLNLPPALRSQVKQMASRIHQSEDSFSDDPSGQETETHEAHHDNLYSSALRDRRRSPETLFRESSASHELRRDIDNTNTSEQLTELSDLSSEISEIPNESTATLDNLNDSLELLNDPRHHSSTILGGGNIQHQCAETVNILKRKMESQFTQSEKSSLENRIFVLENENAHLTREVKRLRNSQPNANARNDLAQYLAQQLKSTRELVGRNKSTYMEEQRLTSRSIHRKYNVFHNNVRDACLDFAETNTHLCDPATKFDSLAQTWARRVFCQDLRDCLYSVSKDEFSKDHLITGLVVAAIFERVFEPVFPDILNTESPASHKYRKYLALKDGPDELHKADLYALQSLVDDKESVILAQKEKILEELILKSLEPLCNSKGHGASQKARHQKPNGDHGGLSSSGPDMETNKRSTLKLGGVLSAALKMKLDLTLSMTRLRFASFRPGDRFDETKMVRLDGSVAGSAHVKACLFPALYLAPPRVRDLESDEYVQEHDPRYNTFFVEATREEVTSLELVAHAVVLT